jgi:hypothetical protein
MASFVNQSMQRINELRAELKALGLNEGNIDNRILSQAELREILQAIDSVEGGWEYLRGLPSGSRFMFNTDETMRKIETAYLQKPTAGNHSGASYAMMMQIVKKIAKFGADEFAELVITYVRANLTSILAEQQRDQQRLHELLLRQLGSQVNVKAKG